MMAPRAQYNVFRSLCNGNARPHARALSGILYVLHRHSHARSPNKHAFLIGPRARHHPFASRDFMME